LKRFIKDRQAKHQWDDADEADFIRGALRIGSEMMPLQTLSADEADWIRLLRIRSA
jgi:hypothetical protein